MRAVALVAALLLAGCVFAMSSSKATIHWGRSLEQCNNNVCAYDRNNSHLAAEASCRGSVTLSWTATGWKHGTIDVQVLDGSRAAVYAWTVRASGTDERTLTGAAGGWSIEAITHDANGVFDASITC